MKHLNFIILIILLLFGAVFKDSIHFSTNLVSLFASKDTLSKLEIADNLGYSKEMLIAVKGFDPQAKKKVKKLTTQLKKLKYQV